jgi:hypothetical protein
MPDSRFTPPKKPRPATGPRAALEALLAGSAGGTLRRAQWLDAVNQLLRPSLPAGAAAHARLANVRGSKLIFVVDAPVWHAKLRLASPELLIAARSIGLEVDAVAIKLATHIAPPVVATARPTAMSATAQRGLAAALALLQSPATDTGGDHPANTARVRKPPG